MPGKELRAFEIHPIIRFYPVNTAPFKERNDRGFFWVLKTFDNLKTWRTLFEKFQRQIFIFIAGLPCFA